MVAMPDASSVISFTLDGRAVEGPADGVRCWERAARPARCPQRCEDGCSPQGQCGCCTVLVDGQPRVACVNPVARVAGRAVTTVDGLAPQARDAWAGALCATGGSQCRLLHTGHRRASRGATSGGEVRSLTRRSARRGRPGVARPPVPVHRLADDPRGRRPGVRRPGARVDADRLVRAERRAAIEGRTAQRVHPDVALGRGGFADDTAPADALVAVLGADGEWYVAETLAEARACRARCRDDARPNRCRGPCRSRGRLGEDPVDVVGRARLPRAEAACGACRVGSRSDRCRNGARSAARPRRRSPRPRAASPTSTAARCVRSNAREDAVRLGPKRPPLAVGLRADGSGVVRVVRTADRRGDQRHGAGSRGGGGRRRRPAHQHERQGRGLGEAGRARVVAVRRTRRGGVARGGAGVGDDRRRRCRARDGGVR